MGSLPLLKYTWIVIVLSREHFGTNWSWEAFNWFFRESGNFNLFWIFSGAITLAIGLILRFSVDSNLNYWFVHSLWHLFIMLAPFCVFKAFPKDRLGFDLNIDEKSQPFINPY